MSLTFTFDLSQQHFELRYDTQSRHLSRPELLELIKQCEQNYYSGRPKDAYGQSRDVPTDLIALGRNLYRWLDGDGWLRGALANGISQTITFKLNYSLEVQGLNPETDRIALGLAHLPWELLHDGNAFLLQKQTVTMPPMRIVQQRQESVQIANRPLHLLLMATSPEGVQPVLSYEQEEANIVQATQNQPLLLVVEESGSVQELENLIKFYPQGYFDIFHLTGHGLIFTEEDYGSLAESIQPPPQIAEHTPCFITEDEVGNVNLTTVRDLARAFGDRFPKIIFLSGCHTGEVPDSGTVPSMAQALVQAGAQMVLGWARPVYDQTAIVAATAIYRELAAGSSVEQAVKVAVTEMLRQQCPDWHLLRVYRDSTSLDQLVTPLGEPKRERLRRIQPEQDFLDEQDQVKVASSFEFVGRRQPLQRCLKVMKPTSDQVGVLIQGMGGLGKSSLAARLCRRVQAQRPGFQRVVIVGVVDEATLLQKLSSTYEQFAEIPELLNQPRLSLKGRLQNFLGAVEELDRPLLLVLDDFEQNIPLSAVTDGSLRPITPASDLLTALCGALAVAQQDMNAMSRVIITCRYKCPVPGTLRLEKLGPMNPTDIGKKCRLLPDYAQVKRRPEYGRVIEIADGNPRLLEWLLKLLQQPDLDAEALLTQLERTEQEFREDILAATLLRGLTDGELQFLAKLSVFRLPINREILTSVVTDTQPLDKTLALGLVESATTHNAPDYRVPSILTPLLESVFGPEDWPIIYQRATRATYSAWWEVVEIWDEVHALEIVRLALLGKEVEIAGEIGDRIATNWVSNSRFVEALNLCQIILAVSTDHRILGTIARAEAVLGEVDEAISHYQQALDLRPEADFQGKAIMLNNMAGVISDQGDMKRALDLWNQALKIIEMIDNSKGKAAGLSNIAGVIADQGNIARALDLWNQSLEISERIGDVRGKVATLSNIAGVIAQQGNIERALDLWNQDLEISERIGDVQGKAITFSCMAGVIAQQGNIVRALDLWNQSLEILERIGDVKGKATTLSNMAGVIVQQGDIARALDLWSQSLEISERIGNIQGKATTLSCMAGVIAQQGDIERALGLWNQSLEISKRIGNIQGKAATLSNMAGVIAQQGDIERALDLWNQSLEISERIGNVKGKAATFSNMAVVIAQQGDIERALDLWNQSLEISKRIGDVQGEATALSSMAEVIAQQGDIERALDLWNQSLEISERIGNIQGKAAVLSNMAYVAGKMGNPYRQLELFLQAAKALGQVQAYRDLFTVLNNLGRTAVNNPLGYYAQALWLSLRIQVPLEREIQVIDALFQGVPQGDSLESLLAARAMFLCSQRGQRHPQLEQLQVLSGKLLSTAAGAQGITTQETFDTWFTEQQLNDPATFLSRLNDQLESLIADGWVFDPKQL
jgi:tetratricopeptide (TPR) repeat protein